MMLNWVITDEYGLLKRRPNSGRSGDVVHLNQQRKR